MNGRHLAIRYATALYEVALEQKALESVTEDMLALNELISGTPEIREYCLRAHKNSSQESAFTEIAFLPYVSMLTGNMIVSAVRNGRLDALPLIPAAFGDVAEKRAGIIRVLLETAHEPLEGVVDLIAEKMRRKTGQPIKLQHRINPELMGGFKIWYAGRLIDNSAAGRLIRMQRLLKSI